MDVNEMENVTLNFEQIDIDYQYNNKMCAENEACGICYTATWHCF